MNGLFIPGGADKTSSDGYYRASQAFYHMAIKVGIFGDFRSEKKALLFRLMTKGTFSPYGEHAWALRC